MKTPIDRWAEGIPHDPRSIEMFKHLAVIDWNFFSDSFCWKSGGDGDNGETFMYQLDIYFEMLDAGTLGDLKLQMPRS